MHSIDKLERCKLLAAEYIHIQEVIERFDERALTIKAWSVTASMAGLGAAFTANIPEVLLLSAVSSLVFWFIEARWKTFQYAYYPRSEAIESFFRGETDDLFPMQIGESWFTEWKKRRSLRLLRAICWQHVALPHSFIFCAGVALYLLARRGFTLI